MPALLTLLVSILILALVVWFAMWLVDLIPLPPTPKMIAKAIVGLIALLYVLGWLFGYAPRPLL